MRRLAIAFLAAALSACVHVEVTATTTPAPSAPAASYIAAAHLDAGAFLAPPPAAASEEQAADLAAVARAQALRGTPRWALAQSDDNSSPFTAFAQVLGPNFTPERAPRLRALFEVMFNDARSLTAPAKEHFGRPRPPVVSPGLQTCMPLEQTRSYPSGHSTRGWMMALVLAEMVPERANAILDRGRDYGDSRIVCAEHFPTDVAAGRLIGAAVFAAARTDPAFNRDYEAARTELRGALGL